MEIQEETEMGLITKNLNPRLITEILGIGLLAWQEQRGAGRLAWREHSLAVSGLYALCPAKDISALKEARDETYHSC